MPIEPRLLPLYAECGGEGRVIKVPSDASRTLKRTRNSHARAEAIGKCLG